MPLRRISASTNGALNPAATTLASEAIRLPAGQRVLNRRTESATALIVAQGDVDIGTLDDNASLSAGEGVLLDPDSPYSLVAQTDSLTLLFTTQ